MIPFLPPDFTKPFANAANAQLAINVTELRKEGKSIREIANELGITKSKVERIIKRTNDNTSPNIKSYSIKHNGYSWGYSITTYDENGKRKNLQKSTFNSEQEAKEAAETVLAEMFASSDVVLRRVK